MTADRIPLEGCTIDTTPNEYGNYAVRGPSSKIVTRLAAGQLRSGGIPIPRPPLVGPTITLADGTETVMDEREVRAWAAIGRTLGPAVTALIDECRRLVREYDEKWGKS